MPIVKHLSTYDRGFWLRYHKISEAHAIQAEEYLRFAKSEPLKSQEYKLKAKEEYFRAARAKEKAIWGLTENAERTIGITVISAVSLFLKANENILAEMVISENLSIMPEFAKKQIKELFDKL